MRVLAVTNLFPNPWQPNRAPFNRQQLGALARRHQVCVIAPIPWTDEFSLRRRRAAPALLADRRVTCGGLDIVHPRYLFPPRVLRGFYGHLFRRCIEDHFHRAVDRFKPDIVLAAWAYPDGWAAVQLAREAGLTVVIKVHGSDVLLLPPRSARSRRTAQALQQSDAVVAVSRHLADRVAEMGVRRDKISVVYNGLNTGLFCPGDRASARRNLGIVLNTPLVLYVGNLLPVKGVDVLLDACRHLARSGASFQCHLIGHGPMCREFERRITESGLRGSVLLVGPRPLEQLTDWYRAANVLVVPSRSEGVPNVALEAMACGTPVVATDVGGIPEIVDRRYLVPPENPQALAEAIDNVLTNAAPPIKFVPMTWDQSATELAAVLASTIRNSSLLRRAA